MKFSIKNSYKHYFSIPYVIEKNTFESNNFSRAILKSNLSTTLTITLLSNNYSHYNVHLARIPKFYFQMDTENHLLNIISYK